MTTDAPDSPQGIPDMHRRVPQLLARRFWQVCNTLQSEAYADRALMPWQFGLLIQVRDNPGKDRNWHAVAVGVDATSVGQILDRWVSEEIATRAVNPKDRRSSLYELTPAGVELVRELLPRSRAVSQQILAPLNQEESRILLELLARLVDAHEVHARPGAGRRPPRRSRPSG